MANHSNVLESPGQRSLGWGRKSWTRLSAIFVFFLSSLCLYVSSTIINTINPWINVWSVRFFFSLSVSLFFFWVQLPYNVGLVSAVQWNASAVCVCLRVCTWVQSLSRVQLCNPKDYSMPGFSVHHQLPEFAQTQMLEIHQDGKNWYLSVITENG